MSDILLSRPKKIRFGYKLKYGGTLYEFAPIVVRFNNPIEGKTYLTQKMSRPKVIIRHNSSYRVMAVLNELHPNKSPDSNWYYYKDEFYTKLCLGDWQEMFTANYNDTENMARLIHAYLSVYSAHGYYRLDQKEVNRSHKCSVCQRDVYTSTRINNNNLCIFCQYNIRIKTSSGVGYYYGEDVLNSSNCYWSNRLNCFLYFRGVTK